MNTDILKPRRIAPDDDHDHRYFIFKTFETYELFEAKANPWTNKQLYEKVEYAVLGCNCGSVVRQKVLQA